MLALVYDRFGGPEVLVTREVPAPRRASGEVLVRVRAAALNPKDVLLRKGRMRWAVGGRFPRPFGHDFAGEVVHGDARDGPEKRGSRVFGCWNDVRLRRGSFAELVCVRPHELAFIPPSLGFAEAAALPLVGQTALQALRDLADVGPRSHVLVHGAAGGVGTVAIQIGRALGARITSTSSPASFPLCASLGAEATLDHAHLPREAAYDAVFDVFGNLGFRRARTLLTPNGCFVSTVPSLRIAAEAARTAFSRQRARLVLIRPRRADLETLAGWVERGLLRPVLHAVYDWAAIHDAVRDLETRHAHGKIVVRLP